jgi:hypothetical protein
VEGFEIMLNDLVIDLLVTAAMNLIIYIVEVDNAKPSPLTSN